MRWRGNAAGIKDYFEFTLLNEKARPPLLEHNLATSAPVVSFATSYLPIKDSFLWIATVLLHRPLLSSFLCSCVLGSLLSRQRFRPVVL